jgi:hypothetical protein
VLMRVWVRVLVRVRVWVLAASESEHRQLDWSINSRNHRNGIIIASPFLLSMVMLTPLLVRVLVPVLVIQTVSSVKLTSEHRKHQSKCKCRQKSCQQQTSNLNSDCQHHHHKEYMQRCLLMETSMVMQLTLQIVRWLMESKNRTIPR